MIKKAGYCWNLNHRVMPYAIIKKSRILLESKPWGVALCNFKKGRILLESKS